jgi:hypothetical protein
MESQPPTDDATAVTITASEYRFAGTDVLKAGGRFAITFESAGTELHELHIAKLPEGDERPLDEILHDPEAESTTTSVGHAFACPGTASTPSGADLSASGRYVVVCFIPTARRPRRTRRTSRRSARHTRCRAWVSSSPSGRSRLAQLECAGVDGADELQPRREAGLRVET